MKSKLHLNLYGFWVLLFASLSSSCQTQIKETPSSSKMETKINLSENEWKSRLSDEEYYILRQKGTERPYSGKFLFHKEKGIYTCAACGLELFSSDAKFDSHCGWPSFDKEISAGNIVETVDRSHGMVRTEITCSRCGGHLGHVFEDGPTETGLRYCVNSVSLNFEPQEAGEKDYQYDTITLGGGCFWCTEAVFEQLKGVKSVVSGYSGGHTQTVNYEMVATGATGHAEVVQITYDPKALPLVEILKVFFTVHDPTTLNRQGADVGPQYRSCIFYRNEEQKNLALKVIENLKKEKVFERPIVTEVSAFKKFFKAEEYHQEYYQNNSKKPYCQMVIKPKLDKLDKAFSHLKK